MTVLDFLLLAPLERCRFRAKSLLTSPEKLTTFFAHHCHFPWFHSGVTPWRVTPEKINRGDTRRTGIPHLFLSVRPRLSTIVCKFAHEIFSFGCHPLEGVTRGGPPAPPSDATVNGEVASRPHGQVNTGQHFVNYLRNVWYSFSFTW